MDNLKVLELFAGIGACSKALERLNIPHEIVDAVEIDKYAVASFNAVHGTNFMPQDITKWDKDIEVDLIMHGSPCQDFSSAGLQAGGDKDSGTRSSLMYETLRIVEKIKPKYVIWENVKNLLSKKHIHNFEAYQEAMQELGYTNYYQVLNAKDYSIPQNRERVFTVSIRNDICDNTFKFPEKMVLEKKLKDILDDKVDEKYFLDDIAGSTALQREVCNKAIDKGLVKPNDAIEYTYSNARLKEMENGHIKKQNGANNQVMSTLKTNPQQIGVCVGTPKDPFVVASRGRGEKGSISQHLEARHDGTTNTLTSVQKDNYVATPYRIRKLTPKECWRLMGFDDEDFEKAQKINSSTQLYKQAGNSIVVNVLENILVNLLEAEING